MGVVSTSTPSVASVDNVGVATEPAPIAPEVLVPELYEVPHMGSLGVDWQMQTMLVAAKDAFEQS